MLYFKFNPYFIIYPYIYFLSTYNVSINTIIYL